MKLRAGPLMSSSALDRFRRLADNRTLVLTHSGRRTGKPYKVTIWFVLEGERIFISTANIKRQWVRNVLKTPQISLEVGGEKFEAATRFLAERSQHEHAMAAIRRKYWMFSPVLALGHAVASLGLMRNATGSFEVTLAN